MNNANLPAILPTGHYNTAHIMRRAGQLYRRFNGRDQLDRKVAMLTAWAEARGERALFEARNGWHCTRMLSTAPGVSIPA